MAKIIFESENNRKGLVDKLYVQENDNVKKDQKLIEIITQSGNKEILAPYDCIINGIQVYENKVINSNDTLFNIDSINAEIVEKKIEVEVEINPQELLKMHRYNKTSVQSENEILGKKSETELFREELIETLLAREVSTDEEYDELKKTHTDLFNKSMIDQQISEPSISEENKLVEEDKGINEINESNENNGNKNDEQVLTSVSTSSSPFEEDTQSSDVTLDNLNGILTDLVDKSASSSSIKQEAVNETSSSDETETQKMQVIDETKTVLNNNEQIKKLQGEINYLSKTLDNEQFNSELQNGGIASETDPNENYLDQPFQNPTSANNESNASFDEKIKLNANYINKKKQLLWSKQNIPHGFVEVEVDVSELVSLLSIMREAYLQQNIDLTLIPFYIKAVYSALSKFPLFNASYYRETNEITFKKHYNIAISVDTPNGMEMPVLKNVKESTVKEIAIQLTSLIVRTINNQLANEDFENSTFSLLNFGEYGITRGGVTIAHNQTANISMGIIFKKPVVVGKNDITIRDIMVISLSYDETVIDITEASRFLHYVAYLLANPGLLL